MPLKTDHNLYLDLGMNDPSSPTVDSAECVPIAPAVSGRTDARPSSMAGRKRTTKSWAEMSEDPDTSKVSAALDDALEEHGDSFHSAMEYLALVVTSVITAKAKQLIDGRRDQLEAGDQKTMVSHIHDLTTDCKKYTSGLADSIAAANAVVDELNKKKGDILAEMERFVRQMTGTESLVVQVAASTAATTAQPTQQRARSWAGAAGAGSTSGGAPVDSSLSTMTTRVGLVDITAPIAASRTNVPPMSIRFCPNLGVFLINLDGDVYSFGGGKFVSRRGTRVGEPTTLYGRRCNARGGSCDEATCTYYHDPLKHQTGHVTRNMPMQYIIEELIRWVATDEDIGAVAVNTNQFIVEDLVHLAGMLLLKSVAVKRILRSSRPTPNDRNTGANNAHNAPASRERGERGERGGRNERRHRRNRGDKKEETQ